MKKKSALVLLIGFFIITANLTPQAAGFTTEIEEESYVEWRIDIAPRNNTIMYYSGGGNMIAENESIMSCFVNTIDDDISGDFVIGNVSITANDTDIAKDLVLGVWGTHTEWWPGLFVEIGGANIAELNATAYAAAERLSGNYLNGTMNSRYENITIIAWNSTSETYYFLEEECIVFDYEQDPPLFGDPQITHLCYSLNSGVLVKANTSYSFGIPYNLVVTLSEITPPSPHDYPAIPQIIVFSVYIGASILAIIVLVYMWNKRRK
ncbi:hypothetical protein EU527_02020 [Candidatus Thorarchaeota archaeon]|nr:MAG: hypothetical protein EU527_02020 [Candidatus Thorarchaeota archaeon]